MFHCFSRALPLNIGNSMLFIPDVRERERERERERMHILSGVQVKCEKLKTA
jgi:hypothetical protein